MSEYTRLYPKGYDFHGGDVANKINVKNKSWS